MCAARLVLYGAAEIALMALNPQKSILILTVFCGSNDETFGCVTLFNRALLVGGWMGLIATFAVSGGS